MKFRDYLESCDTEDIIRDLYSFSNDINETEEELYRGTIQEFRNLLSSKKDSDINIYIDNFEMNGEEGYEIFGGIRYEEIKFDLRLYPWDYLVNSEVKIIGDKCKNLEKVKLLLYYSLNLHFLDFLWKKLFQLKIV